MVDVVSLLRFFSYFKSPCAGKTTFLRLLTGEQPADSGEIEIGETIVLGVYDQMGLQLKADQDAQQTTVLAFVTEAVLQSFQVESRAMADSSVEARRLLNKFEFPRSRWKERISVLSGGEKRRLQMLSVLSRLPVRTDIASLRVPCFSFDSTPYTHHFCS
jgi:ABC transport system ATP-binding/permease protein